MGISPPPGLPTGLPKGGPLPQRRPPIQQVAPATPAAVPAAPAAPASTQADAAATVRYTIAMDSTVQMLLGRLALPEYVFDFGAAKSVTSRASMERVAWNATHLMDSAHTSDFPREAAKLSLRDAGFRTEMSTQKSRAFGARGWLDALQSTLTAYIAANYQRDMAAAGMTTVEARKNISKDVIAEVLERIGRIDAVISELDAHIDDIDRSYLSLNFGLRALEMTASGRDRNL